MKYESYILQALMDSYERSSLSRKENKVAVHISFPITKKTLPEYFDENSLEYEEIHAVAGHLEEMGFTRSEWKRGKKNHILQKIILCEERADAVYRYLGRAPEKQLQEELIQLLGELQKEIQTEIAGKLILWLTERLKEGKSVKEYLELDDPKESKQLIYAVAAIEENQKESYLREFSVRCFGDSKALEKRLGRIGKVFRRFSEEFAEMDNDSILAEYGIYSTPNYVYVKGCGSLLLGNCGRIELAGLRQGIGISGEDLEDLEWLADRPVKRVITIENLTTFFRWDMADSVLIYLGGYHNRVRRKLLQKLYRCFPQAEYFHFGDIDVGGFEIYRNLCDRTGIPFHPYKMGISELKQYAACAKELTANDLRRLESLLKDPEYENVWPVLQYMKESGRKLEQESISNQENDRDDFTNIL